MASYFRAVVTSTFIITFYIIGFLFYSMPRMDDGVSRQVEENNAHSFDMFPPVKDYGHDD